MTPCPPVPSQLSQLRLLCATTWTAYVEARSLPTGDVLSLLCLRGLLLRRCVGGHILGQLPQRSGVAC